MSDDESASEGVTRSLWRTVRDVDIEEVLCAVSLVLIGFAFWDVCRPLSFGIPGFVILWVALPPRPPFIDRTPQPPPSQRRRG